MKITLSVQQHLVLFHVTGDSGKWLAVTCKKGAERILGRRMRPNERVEVELTAVELSAKHVGGACPKCDGMGIRVRSCGDGVCSQEPCPACAGTGLEAADVDID